MSQLCAERLLFYRVGQTLATCKMFHRRLAFNTATSGTACLFPTSTCLFELHADCAVLCLFLLVIHWLQMIEGAPCRLGVRSDAGSDAGSSLVREARRGDRKNCFDGGGACCSAREERALASAAIRGRGAMTMAELDVDDRLSSVGTDIISGCVRIMFS